MSNASLPAETRIGHVHLKVSDLGRAIRFYRDLMRFGDEAAFLSAGGYHHHIGLNTWESANGPPPLAVALKRLLDNDWSIDDASDPGTHEAIYLHAPNHNGI